LRKLLAWLFCAVLLFPLLGLFIHQWDWYAFFSTWFSLNTGIILLDTLKLVGLVAVFLIVLGLITGLADFFFNPKKKWSFIHLLPLSIPLYLGTFSYGFIQGRPAWSSLQFLFPDGGFSLFSLALIFSFLLYPYVYVGVKISCSGISTSQWETLSLYGSIRSKAAFVFQKIAPGLFGGVFLASFEVLNEFGAIKYAGLNTLTTAIFQEWFSKGNLSGALYLAQILLILAFTLNYLKNKLGSHQESENAVRIKAPKAFQFLGLGIAHLPLIPGFIIPLVVYIYGIFNSEPDYGELASGIGNSLMLMGLVVGVALILGLALSIYLARKKSPVLESGITLGYTIPGALLAIGFLGITSILPASVPIYITAPFFCLSYIVFVRLFPVLFHPLQNRSKHVSKSALENCEIQGINVFQRLKNYWIPHFSPALIGGAMFLAVDVLKELPITLILRPFNFSTLATLSYEYAEDEMLLSSFHFGIWIILVSLITLIVHETVVRKKLK
jgi:iron(III) transport system permease protein